MPQRSEDIIELLRAQVKALKDKQRWRLTVSEEPDMGEVVENITYDGFHNISSSNVPVRDFKYWRPVGDNPCQNDIEEFYAVKDSTNGE